MIKKIKIKDAIILKEVIFVDVRSPKEFNEDSIPDAINLPILNDKEREEVGYLYKQVDVNKAKELGLKYASSKLLDIYKNIKALSDRGKNIVLYCYRGGTRSNSVANILDIMGVDVFILDGGYKQYRKYVKDSLSSYNTKYNYLVLHGYTGVGKTKILKELESIGVSVLDLENLAKNSGSVFGSLFFSAPSNTQKKFESLLLRKINSFNDNLVVTESESKRIGKVILPEFVYDNMQNGFHILIKTNMKNRIENILDDYGENKLPDKNEKLSYAVNKLRKRLGNSKTDDLINKINIEDYKGVIESLMIDYYDPLYDYSIKKYSYDMIVEYNTIKEAVNSIVSFINKHRN